LRRIVGENPTSLKLSVMADAERTDYHHDILPKERSVLDCIVPGGGLPYRSPHLCCRTIDRHRE